MTVRRGLSEPPAVRRALIAVALLFVTLFLIVPLCAVFTEATAKGWMAYREALSMDPATAANAQA